MTDLERDIEALQKLIDAEALLPAKQAWQRIREHLAATTEAQQSDEVTDEYARAFRDGWLACKRGDAEPPVPAQQPAAAVPAESVTPMRQPRADLARLVESISATVYANGNGLSVTEAVGALELAKHEILQEQGQ